MKLRLPIVIHILYIFALLLSCADETELYIPTASDRIGFEVGKEWNSIENGSTRSETTTKRRMISATSIGGQLPEGQDSLFLQVVEDVMPVEEPQNTATRSILRPGYYYTKIALSAYRYLSGTWNETQTPNYFNNVTLDVTAQSAYTDYVWPGEKYSLRFFGTAPSGHGTLSASDKPGYPTLDYTVPTEISKQVSLITVFSEEYRGDFRQYVPLNFHHVTSSIYFKEADGFVPGSIKSISLKGLYGSGTYNFKTDSWTNLHNRASYTSTLEKRVTGMDGEDITDYLTAFTVLPQQTPEEATVEVVYMDDYTKEERTLTGVLSCRFEAGKRYDIYISPQSIRCEYSLGINFTNTFPPVFEYMPTEGSGQSPYYIDLAIPKDRPIDADPKRVRLSRTIIQKGKENEEEYLELVKDCNLEFYKYNPSSRKYDIPVKITETMLSDITYNGVNDYYKYTYYNFHVKKPPISDGAIDRALKEMPEYGSDERPYNLSNATGDTAVQNTANCYIVNAPGTYSIPIVYGNAIKNGEMNTKSLTTDWFTTNTQMERTPKIGVLSARSKGSVTYVEKTLSSPYIVDHKPATTIPANYIKSAKILWQSPMNDGQNDIITDLRLSDDRRTLTFKINRSDIRQGNALIAIIGTYEMWSWHIWITDYVPGQNDKTLVNKAGKRYTVMPCYLGWVDQREGNDRQICRMVVNVKGTKKRFECYPRIPATLNMYGESPLYQWGRSMPFMNPLTSPISYTTYTSTLNKPLIFSQCSPMIVFSETQSRSFNNSINAWNWINTNQIWTSSYTNDITEAKSWNTGETVKSIYDPCPVGYCIPMGDTFTGLSDHWLTWSSNSYLVKDSQYSNADEIYCNPFELDPEDTYILPLIPNVIIAQKNFLSQSDWGLWTSSIQYQSGNNGSPYGHAVFRNQQTIDPRAAPTACLLQVIPMREP